MEDREEWYNDRPEKYKRIIHSEINAILHCREAVTGFTSYTFPIIACERCAAHIIQSGIARVVSCDVPLDRGEGRISMNDSVQMLENAGVEVTLYERV